MALSETVFESSEGTGDRFIIDHYITHHLIDPSPEGATGKAYLAVLDIGEHASRTRSFLVGTTRTRM